MFKPFRELLSILDSDGLTIIDVGLPRSEKKILAYVVSLGQSARDVKRIVITHADFDHFGSLAALHRLTGARVYTSKIEADAIAQGKSSRQIKIPARNWRRRWSNFFFNIFMKPTPFQVDETLMDGQVLPILGGLRVVETPGHISLYAPEKGILFCGDSMVTYDNEIDKELRPIATWNQAISTESNIRQSKLGATIVCPGHGPVVTDAVSKFPV